MEITISYIKKINELINEIETYEKYKAELKAHLRQIDKNYQKRVFGYFKYKNLIKHELKGKTKQECIEYYDAYIYSLLKQIEFYNSKIFYDIYNDRTQIKVDLPIKEYQKISKRKLTLPKTVLHVADDKVEEIKPVKPFIIGRPMPKARKKAKKLSLSNRMLKTFGLRRKTRKKEKAIVRVKNINFFDWLLSLFGVRKRAIIEEFSEKEDGELLPGQEMEFLGDKTEISPTIIGLKQKEKMKIEIGSEKLDPKLLAEEAKRIKHIIDKRRKFKVYEHSKIGTMANLMVKRISLYLINTFPDFFKSVYDSLRHADIKILSNTFVNIMILGSVFSFFLFTSFFLLLFYFKDYSVLMIIFNGLSQEYCFRSQLSLDSLPILM